MKKYKNKSLLFLILSLIDFFTFITVVTNYRESNIQTILILILPVLFLAFVIISIVNALKNAKSKKSAKNVNLPDVNVSEDNSKTPKTEEQNVDEIEERKPIVFYQTLNRANKILEAYKVYSNVYVVANDNLDVPKNIKYDEAISIKKEPNNKYDPNAIAIYLYRYPDEIKIGYLSRSTKLYEMANDFISRGDFVLGRIDDEDNLTVALCFYKSRINPNCFEEISKRQKPISKMSYTAKEDDAFFDVGEEITVIGNYIYICDTEKEVSETVKRKAAESGKDLIAFVSDCEYLESGKEKIKISIFLED